MNKEKIKDILYNVRNEFENEIDDYETSSNRELTNDDLNIMFEFLDCFINKVETMIDEVDNNVYFELCKTEVECAIEDLCNDDLWGKYEEQLTALSEEDINRIAWKVEDYDIWDDIYECARGEVLGEINEEEESE